MRTGVLVVCAAVLLSGCSSGGSSPSASPAPAAQSPAPSPSPVLPVIWPLNGMEAGEDAERPVVTVKVDNAVGVRPQAGLNDADVVFEELVEGGVTRFAAMFHSRLPERVGPVRSIRNVDASIIGPTQGVLAYSGGAAHVVDLLESEDLLLLDEPAGGAAYSRDPSRKKPNNLFVNTSVLAEENEDRTSPEEFLSFSAEPLRGTPTSGVSVPISPSSAPRWAWDPATSKWLRFEKDRPATSDGTQISAVNVLVLKTVIKDAGYRDAGGNPVPETVFTGTGGGTLLRDGERLDVTWSKASTSAPIELAGPDGAAVGLRPGNTWVELAPSDAALTFS